MLRAGWAAGMLSASKLYQSVSTSGPSATVKPMPTKTSSSASRVWVTRWRWPRRRSTSISVRSRRSADSVLAPGLGLERRHGARATAASIVVAGLVERLAHGAALVGLEPADLLLELGQRGRPCPAPRARRACSSSRVAAAAARVDRLGRDAMDLVDHRRGALPPDLTLVQSVGPALGQNAGHDHLGRFRPRGTGAGPAGAGPLRSDRPGPGGHPAGRRLAPRQRVGAAVRRRPALAGQRCPARARTPTCAATRA